MKYKTTCPESQRENLKRYLAMRYNHAVHLENDKYPAYKLKQEISDIGGAFCYLNDCGVRIMCLEMVDMFTVTPQPIPKTKTAWQVFMEYLQDNDFVIDFVPDAPRRPNETKRDGEPPDNRNESTGERTQATRSETERHEIKR